MNYDYKLDPPEHPDPKPPEFVEICPVCGLQPGKEWNELSQNWDIFCENRECWLYNLDPVPVNEWNTRYNDGSKIKIKIIDPRINELEDLLETHDWTFEMSDDPNAYRNGRDQFNKIRSLVSDLDLQGRALLKAYYPKNSDGCHSIQDYQISLDRQDQ